MAKQYRTFKEFYPFYLSQHSTVGCRRLHVLGELLVITVIVYALGTQTWWALLLAPVHGYACAWTGHYFIEKNTPATFTYPLYSFIGDWVMLKDYLLGKIER